MIQNGAVNVQLKAHTWARHTVSKIHLVAQMQEVLQPDLKIGLGKAVKQGGYFWILHVFLLAHLRRLFQRGSGIPAIFKKVR